MFLQQVTQCPAWEVSSRLYQTGRESVMYVMCVFAGVKQCHWCEYRVKNFKIVIWFSHLLLSHSLIIQAQESGGGGAYL